MKSRCRHNDRVSVLPLTEPILAAGKGAAATRPQPRIERNIANFRNIALPRQPT
jgi:hypothetical protein